MLIKITLQERGREGKQVGEACRMKRGRGSVVLEDRRKKAFRGEALGMIYVVQSAGEGLRKRHRRELRSG